MGAAAAEGDDAVGLYVLVNLYAIENILVGLVLARRRQDGEPSARMLPTERYLVSEAKLAITLSVTISR